MKKEELIKVIAKELYDSEEDYGEINAISTENNYKDVAERIVNKFFVHSDIGSRTDKEKEAFAEGYELGCKETANDLGSRM